MAAPRTLDVHLLGGFRVAVGNRPIPAGAWRRKRAAALVKLLALEPTHRLHREQIVDALWPELDPDAAANNFRVALHHARQRLHVDGDDAGDGVFLDREGDLISLGPSSLVNVDVDRFDEAVRQAWRSSDPETAERALSLYGGDLLPEDLYEDWAAGRRETLRASFLTLLHRLAQLHEERGSLGQAIAVCHRLVAAEPLEEERHADLMRLLALAGEPQRAIAHYATLAALLERELDAEPQPKTRELVAAIREGRVAPAQVAAATTSFASPGAADRPSGLPAPIDDLIGRERELAELRHLLAARRLVTLTGPGGVGKTRLALALAHGAGETFPDAAVFADLAPLDDANLVLPTLARSLGVRERSGSLLDAVADQIGSRRVLLLVDNMEHVVAAAPAIADLLAICPGLTAIVTSRVRLKLHGEQEYLVEPLPVPEAAGLGRAQDRVALPASTLAETPSVALFVRRAGAAQTGFGLTADNAAVVAEICRRLDGLPLAIELAAARVRVLPPPELLARLEQPLAVLTDGPRDAPDRQRTLRAAIAWSYDLLAEPEQDVFARLSVFAGGFTLDAAEGVGNWTSDVGSSTSHVASDSVLDVVARLVDHSLVRQMARPDGESRFGMLETIREFARERLDFGGEGDAVRGRHADFYLALALAAESELTGPRQGAWLDRFETEHDNLRQALRTFREIGGGGDELRLAAALWRFWHMRGYLREGRSWLEQALADADADADADDAAATFRADAHDGAGAIAEALSDLPAAAIHHGTALGLRRQIGDRAGEARALTDLGIIADTIGDPERAVQLFAEAIALARTIDDRPRLAAALANLGFVCLDRGEHGRAAAAFRESLDLFRVLGDDQHLSYVLGGLANLLFLEGDYAGAVAMQEESLRVLRALGDAQGIANATVDLGHAIQRQGDWDRAETLYAEALHRYRDLGDRSGMAFALIHLGRLAQLRGEGTRAEALLHEGLHIAWVIGETPLATEAIEGLAETACGRGGAVRCAQLLGMAEVLRETTGIPLPAVHEPAIAWCVATARAALGDSGFAVARGEGRALSPERIMPELAASGAG